MIQVTAGRLNKQIAGDIGITESTVKVHRANLMRKMKARSLPELSRMADALKLASQKPQALRTAVSPLHVREEPPPRVQSRVPDSRTALSFADLLTHGIGRRDYDPEALPCIVLSIGLDPPARSRSSATHA